MKHAKEKEKKSSKKEDMYHGKDKMIHKELKKPEKKK